MHFVPIKDQKSIFGFSLLEVLSALAVFLIVLGMVMSMVGNISDLWMKGRDKSASFEEANAAYDTLTRFLAQAGLNNHWGYVKNSLGYPTAYQRESALHFEVGWSATLLHQNASYFPGMAIFFQAPTGRASDVELKRLSSLLNGYGYFTVFGEAPHVPAFLKTKIPPRYRFRLVEWQEPTEELAVYDRDIPRDAWFSEHIFQTGGEMQNTAVLSENIVALILLAEYPKDGGVERSYLYDSRGPIEVQKNQLPPRIHVLMLAISEASAVRLEAQYGSSPPPILPAEDLFQAPEKFEDDIAKWEAALQEMRPPVEYLVFNSTVNIQSAKWSR